MTDIEQTFALLEAAEQRQRDETRRTTQATREVCAGLQVKDVVGGARLERATCGLLNDNDVPMYDPEWHEKSYRAGRWR